VQSPPRPVPARVDIPHRRPRSALQVLIVLTSVDKYPDGSPTGWYLPEAVHPHAAFVKAGIEVEFASITGTSTCDPGSIDASKDDAVSMAFWADEKLKALTVSAKKLSDCDVASYDALFFAGGFGVMWDFPGNADVIAAIKTTYALGKPVAAVCHGPICFTGVEVHESLISIIAYRVLYGERFPVAPPRTVSRERAECSNSGPSPITHTNPCHLFQIDGVYIIKDKEVTGFTNAEENAVGKYEAVSTPSGPGSCEDVMTAAGGAFPPT